MSFFAGSASGVIVAPLASTVRTAPFHVPATYVGFTALPPHCQSPDTPFGSLVISVTNSAGHIGRPDGSTPACAPVIWFVPVWGELTTSGLLVSGDTGYDVETPLMTVSRTPS